MYKRRARRDNAPYEPLVVGGKLAMPAELQRIHQLVTGDDGGVSDITKHHCYFCGHGYVPAIVGNEPLEIDD